MTTASPEPIRQVIHPFLLRRIAAIVYDTIVILGLVLLVTGLIVIPFGNIVGQQRWEILRHEFWFKSLLQFTNLAVIVGFHVGFWSHGGQTLGMRAWRLRVVNNDGTSLNLSDASKRYFAAWLSALPLGLGFLSSLWNPQRLAWHDRISQTSLILIPKKAVNRHVN